MPFILGERNTSPQGAHDGHGRYAEVGPVGPMVGGALQGLVSGCTLVRTLGDEGDQPPVNSTGLKRFRPVQCALRADLLGYLGTDFDRHRPSIHTIQTKIKQL